jgi:hypothetical protein
MKGNLKNTKQSNKRGFADNNINFSDVNTMTASQQTNIFFTKANEFRNGYEPIFANESQFLPNSKSSNLISDFSEKLDVSRDIVKIPITNSISSESLTLPPNKKSDNGLLKFLLVGVGLYLIYNIIEE